ncbi:ASCH domain-containing protein [Nocardioides sp. KIGAM211]|uniref:ASCH domain-containing protein n=1 Tax=Nocardioides luti TaxID=2761101 RepID=A0A7X0V971_9ACTN|nr:ASCH domain-containing protein [Nocardioides luti]
MEHSALEAFWELARFHARLNSAPGYFGPTALETLPPPAWSFGAEPAQADELLALVLSGAKTATAGALWDYENDGDPVPEPGNLSILLDGAGHPRALIEATDVRVVPFDEVDAEHARLEGEGDGSLAHWRDAHERFFAAVATDERGFQPDMPVVLERFRVVYQEA